MVIGDSIVKYLRSDELSSTDKSNHPGCYSGVMVDYVKPVARKKPDTLIIHVETNDLTKGVNTMKKVRKCVEITRELDNKENIQIGFSSIIQRAADKDFRNVIKETNIKLKNYCSGKGFIFVDDNINESCLNNSKLHLNKKGTQRLTKNILSSLDNI